MLVGQAAQVLGDVSCAAADCAADAAALLQGLVKQRVFAPMFGKAADEAKVAEALEGLEKTLQVLDQRLAANQFLAGELCAC